MIRLPGHRGPFGEPLIRPTVYRDCYYRIRFNVKVQEKFVTTHQYAYVRVGLLTQASNKCIPSLRFGKCSSTGRSHIPHKPRIRTDIVRPALPNVVPAALYGSRRDISVHFPPDGREMGSCRKYRTTLLALLAKFVRMRGRGPSGVRQTATGLLIIRRPVDTFHWCHRIKRKGVLR